MRSGYGRLSLAALARALPTPGTAHAREKRLHRFLRNRRLDFRVVSDGLAPLLLPAGRRFCPILLDQTKSGSTQALVAAVPYGGRALPLGCYTFDYPLTEPALRSQNELEHIFLLDLESSFPSGVIPIWVGDRGYARSLLLEQNQKETRVFVIRGRRGTVVTYKGQRQKLGELRAPANRAIRYSQVRYHAQREVPVDIIAYRDGGYEEPWYLLVPAGSAGWLKTEDVVALYRERMQIEQSFRDFKTHLGLRGLDLQVDISARMGRLLLAFCLVYILCVLLGDSPLGEQAREVFEIPRRRARHGTTRTLSFLSIATLMLSHPVWAEKSRALLVKIALRAILKKPLLSPSRIFLPRTKAP